MAQEVNLVYDIGKTNKKLYIFNQSLNEIHQEYTRFDEIKDDDGYPMEDLSALTKWVIATAHKVINDPEYAVKSINFSTYGASLIHLDKDGEVIAPFYNYLKPFPEDLKKAFFEKHHGEANFSLITASPSMGFLNSGLQLYYLKYKKPEIFSKVHKSLHFPQYLSFLLTGEYASDYTSLGCHTGLWDFRSGKYAHWVAEEGLEPRLAPIYPSTKVFSKKIEGQTIEIGIGVHDSSAALIPYIQNTENPFVLISTGTWSICMNFFNERELNKEELAHDCLNFLGFKGRSIKASRLFLGQELREQAMKLGEHFGVAYHRYKTVPYDPTFEPLNTEPKHLRFRYNHLNVGRFDFKQAHTVDLEQYKDFDHAYHQLIHELTDLQIASLSLAIGASAIKDIYIDGGFANNELYTQMLADKLPQYNIYSTEYALGSALGAALLINMRTVPEDFLKNSYKPRIHPPSKR